MREHIRVGDNREFLVAADLTGRGFEVYLGHGKSSFDMVAYKNGVLLRVEVKGITDNKRGKFPIGPIGSTSLNTDIKSQLFDILASVYEGRIQYNRSLMYIPNATSLELTVNDTPNKHTTRKNLERAARIAAKEGECS